MNIFDIGLPKWPLLTVEGDSVTEDQAHEIIFRTTSWPPYCNHSKWLKEIEEITGCPNSDSGIDNCGLTNQINRWKIYDEKLDLFNNRFKILNLEYLVNQRIATASIQGSHGWCNWDGAIGCNTYNIGKYPSIEVVMNEWIIISDAFPFLNLRSQLWSGENCEVSEALFPLIEFKINNGNVEAYKPTDKMKIDKYELNFDPDDYLNREKCCTVDNLKRAMEVILNK